MKLLIFNRHFRDRSHYIWMTISIALVILLPILLATGLYLKSHPILTTNSLSSLLFSNNWRPLSGKFGLLPFVVSSLWVTFISILIAAPICLLTAIYLTQYARRYLLKVMHPVIDILAGIPSVVYGVWGIIIIVPFISKYVGPLFGKETSGYTLLAGALVLAVMIIPFILNIMIDVLRTVPDALKESTLSLGATQWQTVKRVILKKAFPGLLSAVSLGISRAFGETIAVLMVVGNVTRVPTGVLQPGYPLPALIANNYGEMLSIPLYDSALMLSALVLFGVVLLFNLAARITIARYEKKL